MVHRYPGQRRTISASELNRFTEAADRAVFQRDGLDAQPTAEDQQSHWVWVRNDSGANRSRFECMSLGDPILDLNLDGSVDLLFIATASDPTKTPVILLDEIGAGEYGKGVIHGLALAKCVKGAGLTAAPNGSNSITPGGGKIRLLAPPSDSVDKLIPVLLGSASDAIGFRFLEDMPAGHGQRAFSQLIDWSGNVSTGYVYNWRFATSGGGIIDGAQAGYGGLAVSLAGRWAFAQGPCVTSCVSGGSITVGTAPDGSVGAPYTHTVGSIGRID